MPSTTNHGSFAYNTANIHATIRWYHANAAARAAESVTSDDIGKLSWQYDNDTVWLLKDATPTWVQFGGTASVITADAATELTIASGVVTKTQMNHSIDTESDAASDDLDTISGGTAEDLLFIRANNDGRTVVIKHGTGNIVTPDGQDISLDNANKVLILLYDGTNWHAATNFTDVSAFITNPLTSTLDASDEDINDIGTVNLAAATELTISSGSVTATQSLHTIDTESDAASDDLDTVAGGTDGDILFIRANHTDRTVVVKHGTGNILTYNGQDITLDSTDRTVQLISDGTNWRAVTWMVDTSSFLTTTSTSTLTNKTIDADLNTITNLAHGSEVDSPTTGAHGVTGTFVGTTDIQVLTNKTIDADLNTITNLAHGVEVDDPTTGVHGVSGAVVGTTDTQTVSNKTLGSALLTDDNWINNSGAAAGLTVDADNITYVKSASGDILVGLDGNGNSVFSFTEDGTYGRLTLYELGVGAKLYVIADASPRVYSSSGESLALGADGATKLTLTGTVIQAGVPVDLNGNAIKDLSGGNVEISAETGKLIDLQVNDSSMVTLEPNTINYKASFGMAIDGDDKVSFEPNTITMHKHTSFEQTAGFDAMVDNGTKTTDFAIDFQAGNYQQFTINNAGPLVLTYTNPPPLGVQTVHIRIVQGATPGTITWPTTKWVGGTAPTLSTGTGGDDWITLIYDANSTTYWGTYGIGFATP